MGVRERKRGKRTRGGDEGSEGWEMKGRFDVSALISAGGERRQKTALFSVNSTATEASRQQRIEARGRSFSRFVEIWSTERRQPLRRTRDSASPLSFKE